MVRKFLFGERLNSFLCLCVMPNAYIVVDGGYVCKREWFGHVGVNLLLLILTVANADAIEITFGPKKKFATLEWDSPKPEIYLKVLCYRLLLFTLQSMTAWVPFRIYVLINKTICLFMFGEFHSFGHDNARILGKTIWDQCEMFLLPTAYINAAGNPTRVLQCHESLANEPSHTFVLRYLRSQFAQHKFARIWLVMTKRIPGAKVSEWKYLIAMSGWEYIFFCLAKVFFTKNIHEMSL